MLIINGIFNVMIPAFNRSCNDSVEDSLKLNFITCSHWVAPSNLYLIVIVVLIRYH